MTFIFAVIVSCSHVNAGVRVGKAPIAPALRPVEEPRPFSLRAQESAMWCWAASAQMALEAYDVPISQCQQVNDSLGRNLCRCDLCSSKTPVDLACTNGGWPDLGRYGLKATATPNGSAISWERLVQELDAGRPVLFTWLWSNGGGHMMVAQSHLTVDGENYVLIYDPSPPCTGDARWITYAYFQDGGLHHSHGSDLFEIEPEGSVRPPDD